VLTLDQIQSETLQRSAEQRRSVLYMRYRVTNRRDEERYPADSRIF